MVWKVFVTSKRLIPILNQAQRFQILPSKILNITDEYIAFCFNEACEFIISMIEQTDDNGKPKYSPLWNEIRKKESSNMESIKWMMEHS